MAPPVCWIPLALLVPRALLGGLLATAAAQEQEPAPLLLTPEERALAHQFSPLPDPPADPTNAVADDPAAARLGRALFFDPRLSGSGTIACSTCHLPELGWGDGRPLGRGVEDLPRHSMTLWNVAYNRWFFWDGRKDSLWAQALAPLEDGREHAFTRAGVARVVASDGGYSAAYAEVFGPLPDLLAEGRVPPAARPVPEQPEHPHAVAWAGMQETDRAAVDAIYVNVGKSIAAFVRQIVSRRAPFDVFVEGLDDGDPDKLRALSPAAQRGFSLFVGKAQCFPCHDGPTFTDLEFHGNRVPVANLMDGGRATGIQLLKRDPFNTRSTYADDGGRVGRTKLSLAARGLHFPGEFKTPSLRNVARTAPYMHAGQLASLEQVVAFYSSLENALPLDPEGERLIQPRHLTAQEQTDLIAFLEALTDEALPAELLGPPSVAGPSAGR